MDTKMPDSLIFKTIARQTLYIVVIFSLFLMFRGHNEPGGGFIGGLMTAAAITIQYLAFGFLTLKETLPFNYYKMTALGLILAAGTGIWGMFFNQFFLTQWFDYFQVPFFGEIELTTALPFDIGVYLTVVGSVLLIIETLAEGKEGGT